MFRRVVTTVEDDLTEDQWRDYEIDLDKYQSMMIEIETGKAEGREEGRAACRLEIARAMKERGAAAEFIAECTGISMAEAENL